MKYLTPYQRIIKNALLGKGVHLTPTEVMGLALDDAIQQVAHNDDCSPVYGHSGAFGYTKEDCEEMGDPY